jgi:hypothetical protein
MDLVATKLAIENEFVTIGLVIESFWLPTFGHQLSIVTINN